LYATLQRLQARWGKRDMPEVRPETSPEEQVVLYAQLLGAKDPYLAVLYPDYLDAILANKQPEWMLETGYGLVEIEDLR
jgi:hypothetical protein